MLKHLVVIFTLFLSGNAPADENKPVENKKLKLMPTSDDIANDVVKDTAEDERGQEQAIQSSLREGGVVTIDGIRYLAFGSSLGRFLIPAKGADLKREDVEAGRCGETASSMQKMAVGVERPLSAKYTAYAGLMARLIRKNCNSPSVEVPNSVLTPEVGLRWKNGSKNGGEDKVYLEPRGLGFGSSF